jgi:hypothetical protein
MSQGIRPSQVEYLAASARWRARGDELDCRIVADPADPVELDQPVVAIDGRYFTVEDFVKLLAGQGPRGLRLRFVPEAQPST